VNQPQSPNETKVIITKPEGNGLATASLVLGIIGLLSGIIPFIGWFFLPLWILAIVFGAIGMKKEIKTGQAKAGLILGIITIAYKVGFWLMMLLGLSA
jgi:hypothetical protein